MKKIVIFCLVLFCLIGCKHSNNVNEDKKQDEIKTNETSVFFENKTDYKVNIYLDSLKKELLAELNEGDSCTKKVEYVATGNVFYYTYFYNIGSILLPYGKAENVIKLTEHSKNEINLPSQPSEVFQNKVILVVENASVDNSICIKSVNLELIPESSDSSLIACGKRGVYVIDSLSISDIKNYKIVDGTNIINLGEGIVFEKGNVYSLKYDVEKKISLVSVVPLDISIKSKIWKLPLSQKTGLFLTADKFDTRENPADGYLLTGQISYDVDFRCEQSKPYIAKIKPNG